MNSDFSELLHVFFEKKVRYLVVGGYAVIHHSQPRYTKDIDLWLEPCRKNANAVLEAFELFGIPLIGVEEDDFAVAGTQYNIGVSPVQIDFLTTVPGLEFDSAWKNRVVCESEGFPIYYVGKEDLISAKKEAGRPQDLADLDELGRSPR